MVADAELPEAAREGEVARPVGLEKGRGTKCSPAHSAPASHSASCRAAQRPRTRRTGREAVGVATCSIRSSQVGWAAAGDPVAMVVATVTGEGTTSICMED